MNFRQRIEAVMRLRCPKKFEKPQTLGGKTQMSRPWDYIDQRISPYMYEVAFWVPVGFSAQDLMQETDSIAAACGRSIEIIDRLGAVIIRIPLHDMPKVIPFDKRMLKETCGREILLGYDANFDPVRHNFRVPHMLLGGQSGYGKTDLVRFIILQLISRFTPEELWIDIIDGKGFSFLPFRSVPHIRRIGRNLADAYVILKEAREEMSDRSERVWKEKKRDITGGFQWRIVIVDELAVLAPKYQVTTDNRKIATAAYNDMVQIACVGREAGVGMFMATQRGDINVVHPQVKQNLDAKIALKCQTRTNSEIILDHGGAELLPHNTAGRAIYSTTDDVIFQIPYVGNDDEWDKVLSPYQKEGYDVQSSQEKSDFIDVDELSDDID